MTQKATPNPLTQGPLAGKFVCFAGRMMHRHDRDQFLQFLKSEGVHVVDDVDKSTDYLVLGTTGFNTLKKKAEQLNLKSGASINIIDESQFCSLLMPTLDELMAMIRGDTKSRIRAAEFLGNPRLKSHVPSLSGQDLRNADLRNWKFIYYDTALDGIDLSNANLSKSQLSFVNCRLDRANLQHATIQQISDCSATDADFSNVKAFFGHMQLSYSDFTRSKFVGVQFGNVILAGCKFDDADLKGVNLSRTMFPNLRGASVRGADFSTANLTDAKLRGMDLSGCKFVNADLTCADLTDAIVDGADFTGATISGTILTNVDASKAIGLNPASAKATVTIGPAAKAWLAACDNSKRVETSVQVEKAGQEFWIHFTLHAHYLTAQDQLNNYWSYPLVGPGAQTPENVLTMVGTRHAGAKPIATSIIVKGTKAATPGKELKKLAIQMWHELFGVAAPSEAELKEKKQAEKSGKQSQLDHWVQTLRSDPKGVEVWNQELDKQKHKFLDKNFQKVDLSKANLAGWECNWMHCQECNFEQANLRSAQFIGARLNSVQFNEANCQGAKFSSATLKNASCRGADMTGAVLSNADLCGADFTGAILKDAKLDSAEFDEHTKFPKGFKPTLDMKWRGSGASPAHMAEVAKHKARKPLNIDAFMRRLEAGVDVAKLQKALSMLKADRFKLYAQVTDGHLVGIVKSQGDPDLVYSCKLASDGIYGCCTQNLNICGGLRGSLCKHLLVLIVGLTKAGDLDPNTIDTWVLASRGQKPVIDKDAASETFLKYKGAEAGEVDWRPTETIPEDYYAM